MVLLTPSVQAMQALLHTCEDFANEFNVLFNVKKTKCMRVGSDGDPSANTVKLYGSQVVWSRRVKFLGNIITSDLNDSGDISYKKGVFVSQVHKLNCKMSAVSGLVKGRLLQTFCCSWYGCQTWDLRTHEKIHRDS